MEVETKPEEKIVLTEGQILRRFLDSNGHKYSWVATKIGVGVSMLSMILSDDRKLSKESKEKLTTLFPNLKF